MKYSEIWDHVSKRMRRSHLETNFAIYKSEEYLRVINKWCGNLNGKKLLKTDLFEEYFEIDQFTDKIDCKNIYGMDVSKNISVEVKRKNRGFLCVAADVRYIPFRDKTFDFIISNSTLDHLKLEDMRPSIRELRRVLKDDGILVLTIDNKYNPIYSTGLWIGNRLRIFNFPQERSYTSTEIKALMSKEKMEIIEEEAIFNIVPPMDVILAFIERFNRKLSSGISKIIIKISKKIKSKPIRYVTSRQLAFKIMKVK